MPLFIPRVAALSAAAVLVFAATPAAAQLLEHKDLTAAMAITIAQTAIETCKANGYAVSATANQDETSETTAKQRQ